MINHDQREAALRAANKIRCYRAAWKQRARAGEVTFDAVWDDPMLDTMPVRLALGAFQKFGPVKVAKMLVKCGIRPDTKLVAMSDRERQALLLIVNGGYFRPTVVRAAPKQRAKKVVPDNPLLPIDPFRGWLQDYVAGRGKVRSMSDLRIGHDRLNLLLAGADTVDLDTVDKVGCAIGEPGLLDELYPLEVAA